MRGVIVLVVVGVLGCGAPAMKSPGSPAPDPEAFHFAKQDGAPAGGARDAAKKAEDKPRQRMIIYTGRVELVADDFDMARDRMLVALKEHDGYEASSEESGHPGQTRRGVWVLRVPVARFDAYLEAVSRIGEQRQRKTESNDVTDQYHDTREEVMNLEAREKALRKLYDEKIAGSKLTDLLEVDRELTSVRGQINQRKGQMARWEKETAFSTVHVTIFSRAGYVPPTSPEFGATITRTFGGSVQAMVDVGKALVLVAVAAAPWLGILLIVGVPLWLVWRRKRKPAAA